MIDPVTQGMILNLSTCPYLETNGYLEEFPRVLLCPVPLGQLDTEVLEDSFKVQG